MRFVPYLLFWAILCLAYPLSAQHCAFDNLVIYMLNIHAKNDTTVIPNLTITILDSLDIPLKEQRTIDGKWQETTVQFGQNPQRTSHVGYIDNNNPARSEKLHFWFAKNYYTLIPDFWLHNHKIKIEDTDGLANGGHFKTKIIKFNKKYFYRLCTGFGDWQNGYSEKLKDFYKPAKIILDTY